MNFVGVIGVCSAGIPPDGLPARALFLAGSIKQHPLGVGELDQAILMLQAVKVFPDPSDHLDQWMGRLSASDTSRFGDGGDLLFPELGRVQRGHSAKSSIEVARLPTLPADQFLGSVEGEYFAAAGMGVQSLGVNCVMVPEWTL